MNHETNDSQRTRMRLIHKNCHLLLLSMVASIIGFTGAANADISDDWRKLQEQRKNAADQCAKRWKNANYVDPANIITRWEVNATTATEITPGRCDQSAIRRIGTEREMRCLDETHIYIIQGIITEAEARRNPKLFYDCIALLKIEGQELVEYRKSKRYGLQRRVIGVLVVPETLNAE